MVSIGTCPQCAAHLALPETATAADHAQCPECRAEFSLADADQRWLSAATILDPVEPSVETSPAEAFEPIPPEFESQHLEAPRPAVPELGAGSALLSGWEERLKTAIETTASEIADPSETTIHKAEEETPQVPEMVTPESAPKFEFNLDPPTEPLQPQSSNISDEPYPVEPEVTAAVQLKLSPEPPRRKKSLVGIATAVVVPGVVGIFLGLIALVWLKGPEADYLNFASYLPAAMLPTTSTSEMHEPGTELLADEGSQTKTISEPRPAQEPLIAKQEPISEISEPAGRPLLSRDESVQPATAELTPQRKIPEVSAATEQFHKLLEAARNAAPEMIEGDLTTRESIARKGKAYMALCQLAEQFHYVNQSQLSNGGETEALLAKSFFRTAATEPAAQRDLAQIAARWWEHGGRSNQGIFLIGRIQDAQAVGTQTLCTVALGQEGDAYVIPVLLDRFPYSLGDQVGVVGSIVAQPGKKIPAFDSAVGQVVVAHYSFDLLVPQENPLKKVFLPYLAE